MFQVLLIGLLTFAPGDSLRMEMINGKPYVVHQVGEKETLYGLSKRYSTTVADILTQNPTADAGLEVGQILKIPYGGKPKTPDAVKTSQGIVHRVAAKETMFSIARHYNVSVDDIKAWNNLKDGNLSVGQEILIKQKSAEPVEVKTTAAPSAAKTHTVAPKETLFSISRLYGMSVAQLKEWNNLSADEVKIGQVLTVAAPAPGTTPPVPVIATPQPTNPPTAVAPVVVAPAVPASTSPTNPVRISEGLSGANELKETGMASLIQGTEGNRKYLALHPTIKPGTILKIRNLATNQEVFVRVTGMPSTADPAVMIYISKSAYDRLGATDATFRAELTYYK